MPERLLLFGGAVLGDRLEGTPLPVDRRGYLLAYLATDGGWVDRDRLALLFWPETGEDRAKRNLRQLLLRTKRLGLKPAIEARVDALRWPVDSDVAQFRRALASGDHARATALYHGPFLEGFALDGSGADSAWLEAERERLHSAFHGAALREAAALTARGELDGALELLARLHAYDEFAEDVAAAYVDLLARAGRRDAAIEVYERFAAALMEELGLEPLERTRELVEAVKRGELPSKTPPTDELAAETTPLPAPLRVPRLIGRDDERSTLRAAATPLSVVSGAPGSGKSRLLKETFPHASYCGAKEGLEQVPYHPLSRLIRERLDAAASVGGYVEDLARLVPEVAPELSPAPLEAGLARGRLAEALMRFVEAAGSPLVVDDLQWADPATLETIVYLTGRGVRVVGAYRVGEVSPRLEQLLSSHAARGELTTVRLEELAEDDVRDLLADLMQRESGPPTFARWLWQRSSGNPLFLLESIRALFESGTLWSANGAWHTDVDELTQDYTELDVPPVVSEVIARRLGNLSRETQRVLSTVAITGVSDDHAFLAKATGLANAAVADALDQSALAGFLSLDGGFQHDLLRQTVQASVDRQRRLLLHGLAAEHYLARSEPELAAEHHWLAGDFASAAQAWSQHVWELRTRGLLLDAAEVLRRAVARLPEGEHAASLRLRLVDTLREADCLEAAKGELESVTLPADSTPEMLLRHVLAVAGLLLQAGSVAETDKLLRANRHLAKLVDDPELLIDHTMFEARVAREQRRLEDAVALLEPTIARLRRGRPTVRLVQFVTSLAVLHDDLGESASAVELHAEALALARALGSRYYQVEAGSNMVPCLQELGRLSEAAELAEGLLDLGEYDNAPILRINLAGIYYGSGRIEDAFRHYRLLLDRPEPHLRLIALGRCVECVKETHAAEVSEAQATQWLDAALDLLPNTEFAPAVGRALIVTLKHGDARQRERLERLLPSTDLADYPTYLHAELQEALANRG